MGYEVGRLNLESIQLLYPLSSCDQAAYSICGFSVASEEQTKGQFVASAEIFYESADPFVILQGHFWISLRTHL